MPNRTRFLNSPRLQLAVACTSVALAILSAFSLLGEVRLVTVLLLFFGGFGAGASLTAAIAHSRRRAVVPPPPSDPQRQQMDDESVTAPEATAENSTTPGTQSVR